MSENEYTNISLDGRKLSKSYIVDPASLGFISLGLTILFFSFSYAGFDDITTLTLSVGLSYGGIALIIASLMEFKNGSTFGMIIFGSYGLFWITYVLNLLFQKISFAGPTPKSYGFLFLVWGIITIAYYIGTLKLNRKLQIMFIGLTLWFFIKSAAIFTTNLNLGLLAGFEGILTGAIILIIGLAKILNELYKDENKK